MATTYARYKGRTYRVMWAGETRYGLRAHLQFLDGSSDFWCDLEQVDIDYDGAAQQSRSANRPAYSNRQRGGQRPAYQPAYASTNGDGLDAPAHYPAPTASAARNGNSASGINTDEDETRQLRDDDMPYYSPDDDGEVPF